MKIYIGADHRGYQLKQAVTDYLKKSAYDVVDIGDKEYNPDDDFTVFASKAVNRLLSDSGNNSRAILICGSGQGMIMAANRHKGIRAGLGWSKRAAKEIRNDEDSNVLALPSEILEDNPEKTFQIINTWLNTPYAGAARYNRRIKELDNL